MTARNIRTIDEPTPEKIRPGDYVTLRRRLDAGSRGVEVRGTVLRWDPIYADWLTLAGWPNRRFGIDGDRAHWTVTRIQREETVHSIDVPFRTGSADVTYPGRPPQRYRGIYMAGKFYPLDDDGRALDRGPWFNFVGDRA